MYFLFFIALVFAVVFNTQILPVMGYDKMLVTIAFMPMMIYFGLGFLYKKIKINFRYSKDAIHVLIIAAFIIAFKFSVGQDYIKKVIEFLIIPMLVAICFDFLTTREYTLVRRTMIVFFLCECGLAILEKVVQQNFVYIDLEDMESFKNLGQFRSSGFLGHPLMNAMFVAVFMAFVTIAEFKKVYFQIFLFFLGYIALFCFGGRGATLVVTGLVTPFFLWKLNKEARIKKAVLNVSIVCILFGMFYLFTETELGARFQKSEQGQESTKTRLEVFDFYKYYQDQDDFLWGHPDNYKYMMEKLGAAGVENGVITIILDYGIILTIPMLMLLFKFHYRRLSVFPKHGKWLIILVFYSIGTMNPSLAMPIMWVLWIFTYYAFKPINHEKNPVVM